ncbi:MAG: aspartate aminotransferase family protein [Bacilli bacterium]|nr:aspartate aminotransferase family protein [Bacilli bacterium]
MYFEDGEKVFLKAYGRYEEVLEKGEGVYLYDTEGKKYLDFYSGIGVNSFGHNYPRYTSALKQQLETLVHVSNYFYTPIAIEAAQKVVEATKLSRVFFCNSGTEATEGALKLARKYYYNKHGKADSEIISLNHSFHGRSTGSVKLTGNEAYQKPFGPLIDGVKYANINDLDSVKALVNEKTASIIVEPIQGEGGVNPCTKEFLQGLRQICDENDICLILDEVQCGMGRTGTIMTYFQYDIMPDIVCLAKGLGAGVPVGAFVANEKVGAVMQPGDHGSTYGGNPFVSKAVSTVFDIINEEKMMDHVQSISQYLISKLDELVEKYDVVKERRGLGLMQGLELTIPAKGVVKELFEQGVVVVTAGTNVIRMLPPFIINEENVDEFIDILEKILKK